MSPVFQTSIDDLGEPLRAVTFVVVDLETTGGSPEGSEITEIGAVKVRGGEILGEFSTLVNPGGPIPPYIVVLTGITDAMVAEAPPIGEVLPAFLEWAGDAVFVAHNAPFDIGFLKAACAKSGRAWPGPRVLDTVALARRTLSKEEVPNCKLGTLAAFFQAATNPVHRALDDARATVDVLHGLLGRLKDVDTWAELTGYLKTTDPERRRKRYLARGLPSSPGVYVFRDSNDLPLYVGTSTDLASRVASYFTASENRARMTSMIRLAERVETVECSHRLEAEVRELRIIAAHQPPYNKKSKYPRRPPRPVRDLDGQVTKLLGRIERLSEQQLYEEAALDRIKLARLLRGAIRLSRLSSLTSIAELVAARPDGRGGWEISVIRHGRLAAAGTSPPGVHPRPTLDVLLATAETVTGPGATTEETELLHSWLERPETRLVEATAGWASEASGAGRWAGLLQKAEIHTHKSSTEARLDR
ncbi:DEDD exonuclease domain-containing protein [Longispora albida]|uniref:DEDD exonuclease domain-containing protein n=1 Tax=Longispora albida TaxID=203523 RepID=UPI001FDEDBC7|nr:DEDD exonuclease domain-containing protein [Longispora albida]